MPWHVACSESGGARDNAVLFLIELFVFDSGPENGATRTSCGPAMDGRGHMHVHGVFVILSIRAGLLIFGERNFSFEN